MTDQTKEFRNVSGHPEDLADGRMIGSGQKFELDAKAQEDPYNKAKINAMSFAEVVVHEPPAEFDRDAALARAKELDISGASRMRNDQLQTAINEAERDKEGDA